MGKWSESEIQFLLDNAWRKDREIAAAMTRIVGRKISVFAVRRKRYQLGIHKDGHRGAMWITKMPSASPEAE